jgi:uncharacterized protein (DUF2236 family)
VLWKVNREHVLLLGGTRVLLLQIAHPLVAEAVYHHSYVFRAPLKRLLRTLDLMITLVFGTRSEVLETARTINQTHGRVKGSLGEAVGDYPAGAPYNALRPNLLQWVYATLVEGALSGYERFVGPLTQTEKQMFFDDTKGLAELLGLKRASLPGEIKELYGYMQQMIESGEVVVAPKARAIARVIMAQTPVFLKPIAYAPSRITVGLLPPELRVQYGFAFSRREERLFEAFCRGVQRTVPYLPERVRCRAVPARPQAVARWCEVESRTNKAEFNKGLPA